MDSTLYSIHFINIYTVCKQAVVRVLQRHLFNNYITYLFKTTFIPTQYKQSTQFKTKLTTAITQNVTQPLSSKIYREYLYTYYTLISHNYFIVSILHIIHYTIFTLWAYTQPDLQNYSKYINNSHTIYTIYINLLHSYSIPSRHTTRNL